MLRQHLVNGCWILGCSHYLCLQQNLWWRFYKFIFIWDTKMAVPSASWFTKCPRQPWLGKVRIRIPGLSVHLRYGQQEPKHRSHITRPPRLHGGWKLTAIRHAHRVGRMPHSDFTAAPSTHPVNGFWQQWLPAVIIPFTYGSAEYFILGLLTHHTPSSLPWAK